MNYSESIDYLKNKGALIKLEDNHVSIFKLNKDTLDVVEIVWKTLQLQMENVVITSHWDWIKIWLQNFGDVVDYYFLVGVKENLVVGITIISKETNRKLPIPVNAFHVGTFGEPFHDALQIVYNSVLSLPEYKNYFYSGIINSLRKNHKWEEIVFNDFTSSDSLLIQKIINDNKFNYAIERKPCKEFNFSKLKNAEDLLSHYSYDTRYSIRRSLKVFENDIKLEWAEDYDQALVILDELIKYYKRMCQKRGLRGMFVSKRFYKFQKEFIQAFIKEKRVVLIKVASKNLGTLGCVYLYINNNTTFGYQIGINDFEGVNFTTINKKRLRTGFIIHYLCMQECFRRGLSAYNFTIGDYEYKNSLTNNEIEVFDISIRNNYKPALRDFLVKQYTQQQLSTKILNIKNRIKKLTGK